MIVICSGAGKEREWSGTDQVAVIERDLQAIAQEALGGKP